ncbi:hypothetical protein AMK13_00805 [Streptomyces sp. CB02056]|nr:hypothetical protein AMK13_00805 [Streptomyces sp. CB02056]
MEGGDPLGEGAEVGADGRRRGLVPGWLVVLSRRLRGRLLLLGVLVLLRWRWRWRLVLVADPALQRLQLVAELEAAGAQALAQGPGLGELAQQLPVRPLTARGRPDRLVQAPFALARVAARAE